MIDETVSGIALDRAHRSLTMLAKMMEGTMPEQILVNDVRVGLLVGQTAVDEERKHRARWLVRDTSVDKAEGADRCVSR